MRNPSHAFTAGLFAAALPLLAAAPPTASPSPAPTATPAPSSPGAQNPVTLSPSLLDSYAGEYQLAPEFAIRVFHEGARLFAQVTGQPRLEIFARSEGEFYYKAVDAQISFQKENGTVTGLVLHQNGRDIPGRKTKSAAELAASKPPPEKTVAVSPAILETYVGEYQLAPEFSLVVTRDGSRVFAQGTGQPKIELLARSETEFGTDFDAKVSFTREGGKVTGLVLHQGGRDIPAKKIR